MELIVISEFKTVHAYRKRDIGMILLYSAFLVSIVRSFVGDITVVILFLTSVAAMWYVHIGGFTRGIVVQREHAGSRFPPNNLDYTGSFGIWFFGAWDMLKEERKIAEHNRETGNEHFKTFIADMKKIKESESGEQKEK